MKTTACILALAVALLTTVNCEVDDIPRAICLDDHGGVHTFLEGEYTLIHSTNGTNSSVWYLEANAGTEYPAYLYNLQDFDTNNDTQFPLYVIGTTNPNNAHNSAGINVYGYCNGSDNYNDININDTSALTPLSCTDCWRFYFSGSFNNDCNTTLTSGYCNYSNASNNDDKYTNASYYPSVLCLNFSSEYDQDYNGNYQLSNSLYNGRYYWRQVHNKNYGEYYVYYDDFFEYWVWYNELNVSTQSLGGMFCTNDKLTDPSKCQKWISAVNSDTVDVDIDNMKCTNFSGVIESTSTNTYTYTTSSYDSGDTFDDSDGSVGLFCNKGINKWKCLLMLVLIQLFN